MTNLLAFPLCEKLVYFFQGGFEVGCGIMMSILSYLYLLVDSA